MLNFFQDFFVSSNMVILMQKTSSWSTILTRHYISWNSSSIILNSPYQSEIEWNTKIKLNSVKLLEHFRLWWIYNIHLSQLTNSSDSFTNFVTTNLQIFLRKWMWLFTLTGHKNKQTQFREKCVDLLLQKIRETI